MSREDVYAGYEYADVELVELGIDHNGNKQWYMYTREGWQEIGKNNVLMLDAAHFNTGTRIELTNTTPNQQERKE